MATLVEFESSLRMAGISMSSGTIKIGSKMFSWENNPSSGKLDIYDEDGNHIGQAPSVEAAKAFLLREVSAGRLANNG